MSRVIATVCGGILIGVLATLAVIRMGQSNGPAAANVVRDIDNIPQMTEVVAEQHRDEQFINLLSIEQVLALPTEFARVEALHLLAGRSNAGEIQNLIFEANRVADDVERVRLLTVLFFRLTEVDPKSALALARTEQFRTVIVIERTVWQAWARKNLDDALFAAKTQPTSILQNRAAQSLFAAFGYMGNKTTDRIEAELEIGPDQSARARYLYLLADKSPATAIEFINRQERGYQQSQYVSWLANYLLLKDPSGALQYANLIGVAADREVYVAIIENQMAQKDPKATMDRILASGVNVNRSSEFHSAARALANSDLDAAIQYYEQAQSDEVKRYLGRVIVSKLATTAPHDALAWARANEKGDMPSLQQSVLYQIAQTDPQLAFSEAMNTPDAATRSMLMTSVVQTIGRTNPADAIAYLEQMPENRQRLEASKNLAQSWMQHDVDAALAWILSHDENISSQMLEQASYQLLRHDLDAAVRILPKLDGASQARMRNQIAQNLAINRSPQEAQAFVQQYEGEPGYAQLQASVIAGVAKSDVMMARQLADQIADANSRNTAYVQIISHQARLDPTAAVQMLEKINDESMRGAAAGTLAMQWAQSDPLAATRWASDLPPGTARDDAITNMSSQWGELTAEKEELIASIRDPNKRGQAKLRQVYQYMHTDPAKARAMLADPDIPGHQRQQFEAMMRQQGL